MCMRGCVSRGFGGGIGSGPVGGVLGSLLNIETACTGAEDAGPSAEAPPGAGAAARTAEKGGGRGLVQAPVAGAAEGQGCGVLRPTACAGGPHAGDGGVYLGTPGLSCRAGKGPVAAAPYHDWSRATLVCVSFPPLAAAELLPQQRQEAPGAPHIQQQQQQQPPAPGACQQESPGEQPPPVYECSRLQPVGVSSLPLPRLSRPDLLATSVAAGPRWLAAAPPCTSLPAGAHLQTAHPPKGVRAPTNRHLNYSVQGASLLSHKASSGCPSAPFDSSSGWRSQPQTEQRCSSQNSEAGQANPGHLQACMPCQAAVVVASSTSAAVAHLCLLSAAAHSSQRTGSSGSGGGRGCGGIGELMPRAVHLSWQRAVALAGAGPGKAAAGMLGSHAVQRQSAGGAPAAAAAAAAAATVTASAAAAAQQRLRGLQIACIGHSGKGSGAGGLQLWHSCSPQALQLMWTLMCGILVLLSNSFSARVESLPPSRTTDLQLQAHNPCIPPYAPSMCTPAFLSTQSVCTAVLRSVPSCSPATPHCMRTSASAAPATCIRCVPQHPYPLQPASNGHLALAALVALHSMGTSTPVPAYIFALAPASTSTFGAPPDGPYQLALPHSAT